MIPCGELPLSWVRGGVFELQLQAFRQGQGGGSAFGCAWDGDCDIPSDWVPIDLTGATITMVCATDYAGLNGQTTLFTISTTTADIVIIDETSGQFNILV